MGFQNSETVDEYFLLRFSHFIAPVTTTSSANNNIINVFSLTVEVSHHWKVEIFHTDGAKLLEGVSLGFPNVQLITFYKWQQTIDLGVRSDEYLYLYMSGIHQSQQNKLLYAYLYEILFHNN